MNVLLLGAGFKNKGAQLMLLTVCNWLTGNAPHVKMFMSAAEATKEQATAYGIELLNDYILHTGSPKKSFELSLKHPTLYKWIRIFRDKKNHGTGKTKWREIDIVLDLSGLAYSDKWGKQPILNLRYFVEKCKSENKKYILMPQAFGPFGTPELKEAMTAVLQSADLTFARDKDSFELLTQIGGSLKNVIQCPDITHLIKSDREFVKKRERNFFVMIPNARMLDKAGSNWPSRYLDLMHEVVEKVLSTSDLELMLMVHSSNNNQDKHLADQLMDRVKKDYPGRVEIQSDSDPLVLKSIISKAYFVVGSRFHGLVSALSSGTPTLGTSWQHKYARLFEEYEILDYLIIDPSSDVETLVESLIDPVVNDKLRVKITNYSTRFKEEVEEKFNRYLLPFFQNDEVL